MTTKPTNTSTTSARKVTENTDAVNRAFRYINAYKRHRALAEAARQEGNRDKATYNELKQYKNFDGLELAVRAIQKGLREMEDLTEGDDE